MNHWLIYYYTQNAHHTTVDGRYPAFTSWYGEYPIIYRVLYLPGGVGVLPSVFTESPAIMRYERFETNYPQRSKVQVGYDWLENVCEYYTPENKHGTWKWSLGERRNIYQPSILGFHVCLRGCICRHPISGPLKKTTSHWHRHTTKQLIAHMRIYSNAHPKV